MGNLALKLSAGVFCNIYTADSVLDRYSTRFLMAVAIMKFMRGIYRKRNMNKNIDRYTEYMENYLMEMY